MNVSDDALATRHELAALLRRSSADIVTQWSRDLKGSSLASYADRPLDELESDCRQCLEGYIAVIAEGDHSKVRRFINREVRARVSQGFRASELARKFCGFEVVVWPMVTEQFAENSFALSDALGRIRNCVDQALFEFSDMYQMAAQEQVEEYMAEMEAVNRRLEEISVRDPLTGLYNRRYLLDRLSNEFQRAFRHERPLSLLMVDIDHFKSINDTYGHQAGDEVLRAVSLLIVSQTRSTDIAGRYGGEEFCAVLPETDATGALRAAEKLREAVAVAPLHRVQPAGERSEAVAIHATISVGVATYIPGQFGDSAQLIHAADVALYAAKNGGRNRVMTATLTAATSSITSGV